MDKDEKDAIILIILSLLSCGYFFFISSNDWSKDGEMVLRGEKKKPESERRNWTYRNLPVSHTPFFFHLRPNRDLATRLHSRNSIKLAKLWWQRWCLSEKLRELLFGKFGIWKIPFQAKEFFVHVVKCFFLNYFYFFELSTMKFELQNKKTQFSRFLDVFSTRIRFCWLFFEFSWKMLRIYSSRRKNRRGSMASLTGNSVRQYRELEGSGCKGCGGSWSRRKYRGCLEGPCVFPDGIEARVVRTIHLKAKRVSDRPAA